MNNLGEIWHVNIAFLPYQRLVTVTSVNFQTWKFGKLTGYMYRTTIPSFSYGTIYRFAVLEIHIPTFFQLVLQTLS